MTKAKFIAAMDRLKRYPGTRIVEIAESGINTRTYEVSVRCIEPGRMTWNCHGWTAIECRTRDNADRAARRLSKWLDE